MGTRSEQAQGGISLAAMVALSIPGAGPYAPAIIILAMALSLVASRELAEDPEIDKAKKGPGLRTNTRTTQAPLRIVYGKQKLGGNDVYIATSGVDNTTLWIVQTLSEGECTDIETKDGVLQYYLDDKIYTDYGGNVTTYFHEGSGGQVVDLELNAVHDGEWTDPLHYTCYIVWKLVYDKDYFQRLPTRLSVLRGIRVFDFRDGTTEYSTNAVLCVFDYMTNSRYGMGFDRSYFDTASWTAAANYYDDKGWEFGMTINAVEPGMDIVDRILAHFRGELVWYDNKFYLRFADLNEESSVMTLTDKHVHQDAFGKAAVSISQPTRFRRPDGLRVSYIDPEQNYIIDSVPVGEASGVIQNLDLMGATTRKYAADIGVYRLERAQLDRTISGTFRDDALQLEQHDIITFTISALSIAGQLMRVREAITRPDNMIDLLLAYEATSLYDDDYNLLLDNIYTCTLPNPLDEPPAVFATVEEETYYYRLRTVTKLKIDITVPATYPWFRHVEVWWSDDNFTWRHLFNSTGDFMIDPVKEDQLGTTQYMRLKTVSIWGVKTTDTNDFRLKFKIYGDTAAPQSPVGLFQNASGRSVRLYTTRLSDPDIEVYEFRRGPAWATANLVAAYRSPNLFLTDLSPGLHVFWVNTYGTNGLYGESPQSTSVLVRDFSDTVLIDTKTDDYSSGTHSNTERIAYDGEPYLQRSGAALVGTYLSPVFDLGSGAETELYMVSFTAENDITGIGNTWADKFTLTTTWADVDATNLAWGEIFDSPYAPDYTVTLKWGNTSGNLDNEAGRLSMQVPWCVGRYYQVEIVITDPISEVHTVLQNFTLKFYQGIIPDGTIDPAGPLVLRLIDGGTL